MRYLLDTDHLSILQRQSGADYHNLMARMAEYPLDDFAITIITIQEQMLGCHAYINRARLEVGDSRNLSTISANVNPSARLSRMTETIILVPLIQGFP